MKFISNQGGQPIVVSIWGPSGIAADRLCHIPQPISRNPAHITTVTRLTMRQNTTYNLNLLISLLGTDALSVSGSPSFRTRASFHQEAHTCMRSVVEHRVAKSTKARLETTRASAWPSLGLGSGNIFGSMRHSGGNSGLPVETLLRLVYSSADAIRGPIRSPDKIPSSDEFLEKGEMIRESTVWRRNDMNCCISRIQWLHTCSSSEQSSKRNHHFSWVGVAVAADQKA